MEEEQLIKCDICGTVFDGALRLKGNECNDCGITFDDVCDCCICFCDKHGVEVCCDCYRDNHNNCDKEKYKEIEIITYIFGGGYHKRTLDKPITEDEIMEHTNNDGCFLLEKTDNTIRIGEGTGALLGGLDKEIIFIK